MSVKLPILVRGLVAEPALKLATGGHLCYSDARLRTHTCAERVLELSTCCVELLQRGLETNRTCLHLWWVEHVAWRLVQDARVYRPVVRINGDCTLFEISSRDRLVQSFLDHGVRDSVLVLPAHVNAASVPFFECVLLCCSAASNFKGWKFSR